MLSRFAVVAFGLWLVSSCESSGGSGGVDGGSGGAMGPGGATGTGGSTGAGGAAGTSGVAGSKALSAVTAAEKAQFCDWSVTLSGGYNQTKTCPDGTTVSNPANQAECVAEFPSCAATVTQFEACTKKLSADLCNIGAAVGSAECAPVVPCL